MTFVWKRISEPNMPPRVLAIWILVGVAFAPPLWWAVRPHVWIFAFLVASYVLLIVLLKINPSPGESSGEAKLVVWGIDSRKQGTRRILVVAMAFTFVGEFLALRSAQHIRPHSVAYGVFLAWLFVFQILIGRLSAFATRFANDAVKAKPTRPLDERETAIRDRALAGAYRVLSWTVGGVLACLVSVVVFSGGSWHPSEADFIALCFSYSLSRDDLPLAVLAWTMPDIVEIEDEGQTRSVKVTVLPDIEALPGNKRS